MGNSKLERKIARFRQQLETHTHASRIIKAKLRPLEEALRVLEGKPAIVRRPRKMITLLEKALVTFRTATTRRLAERLIFYGHYPADADVIKLANVVRNTMRSKPDLFEWDEDERVWSLNTLRNKKPRSTSRSRSTPSSG